MRLSRALSRGLRFGAALSACAAVAGMVTQIPTLASSGASGAPLVPGNLLVATSVYQNDSSIVAGATQLPPGCSSAAGASDPCGTAVTNGDYPYVFNNDTVDGAFGVTSEITLNQLTTSGKPVSTIEVPNSSEPGITPSSDQMVTSFSSKSELALNLSTDGKYVTFMGYDSSNANTDVSNANTPGDPDPTNIDPGAYYRVVGQLGEDGTFHFTETNAYNGDNGRAAILDDEPGAGVYYTAGNAGNGANPEPPQVVAGAGAQLVQPSSAPESAQNPGSETPVGSFDIQQLGDAPDKVAKDNNYRGLTLDDNVLYYTKGSGGNGVDTVYFVDPTGKACPTTGVGLPEPGTALPLTATPTYDATAGGTTTKKGVTTDNPGLEPTNMCILKGFPTNLVPSGAGADANDYPFGIWFANPTTLYVADEGAGDNTNTRFSSTSNGLYSAAAASTTAGLQKWVFDSSTKQWSLAYTLQSGLNLGVPYTVSGYPTGLNSGAGGTGLPWAPATDGLRNLTGEVNPDGTVTVWAETSTVSGSGDQGADPNELVSITDELGATSLPGNETFNTVVPPTNATVVRGVSFTPGTNAAVSGNVDCDGATYSDTTISGNLKVDPGSSCTLVDATVDGNVQVQSGASLLDTGATIEGNLQADGAASVEVYGGAIHGNLQVQQTTGTPDVNNASRRNDLCGASVDGNLQVQNNGAGAPFVIGAAPDCANPLSIGGNLQVQGNAAAVTVGPAGNGQGNNADGNIDVQDNSGGGTLADNAAGGNCNLQNNTPGIVGSSNTAHGNNSCNITA